MAGAGMTKERLMRGFRHFARGLITAVLCATSLGAQEIAITLDDLPYVLPSRVSPEEGLAIVSAINEALAAHDITATGFIIGQQVNAGSEPAIEAFVAAGHGLGNHSWSHADYGTLTPRQFRRETRRTDRIIAPWLGEARYYRFPYLRQGETHQARARARDILARLGYRNVPVSIDNDEWRFNADYMDALDRDDSAAARQIADAYLAHMRGRTAYYQGLVRDALGRDVTHILLLHMNRLNADHLDRLLDWYEAEGWRFVTVDQALRDPIYAAPDLYAGPRGLSQIERITGRWSD
jgi:peptidoglycan/xylan/chitin deacetylase (PgdA/CDA1 family)